MEELIKRINELAKKDKEEGLNQEESKERAELREKYLNNFRSNMKNTLMNVKLVDDEGNDITPEKLKEEQKNNKLK